VGIREGLSRVRWKLSCTVLRGGTARDGGSLLDKKTAAGKQPYAIGLKCGGLMAMVGLWETWRSPAGERIRSFTIATTTPNLENSPGRVKVLAGATCRWFRV